uniref:Solute carrier family 19 member 3b n=1 Tax=Eptatretus burgeri TaxID=7764 RepID=A0A8C4QTN0_EPTBU
MASSCGSTCAAERDPPADAAMSLAEWRSSWKYPTVILCVYGFFCSIRPSEPYLTPYLVGPDKNLTIEEVNNQMFPVWTYSYLVLLFPVFLATDYLRYKPLIVLQGTAFIVTWLLLLFAQGIMAMQAVEFTFGLSSATEVAYYSYIYSVVPSTKYQMVTGQCRSATLIGYTTGSVIGQILVSAAGVSYFVLNIISMTCVSIAFLTSCLLPTPQHSMFFHRDLTANTVDRKMSIGQISIDNDIHSEKKICQSNSSVCVSDIPKEFEPAEFVDLPLNLLPASAVVSPMVVFSQLWKDFLNCYTNKSLLLWSVWWALATCGYLQVVNYVQTLWSTVGANATVYNGGVEAISTLTAAMASFAVGYIHVDWAVWGEVALGAFSILDAGMLIIMALIENIWVCYSLYIVFKGSYMFLITISTFMIATTLTLERYALVFGVNTFLALSLQTVLTAIVVDSRGLGLDVITQFLIYGGYFGFISLVYILKGVRTLQSHCRQHAFECEVENAIAPPVDHAPL